MSAIALKDGLIVLKGGLISCICCCPTAEPVAEDDSVSASKTKEGLRSFGSTVGPVIDYRIWLSASGSGTITSTSANVGGGGCDGCDEELSGGFLASSISVSGSTVYDYDGNVLSWMQLTERSSTLKCSVTGTGTPTDFTAFDPSGWANQTCADTLLSSLTAQNYSSATSGQNEGCGCRFGRITTGAQSFTLSSEYTTPTLKANAYAAMPAFDGDWNDTAGAYYNLESPTEWAFDARDNRRRWNISSVAGFMAGRTYRLKYKVRFVPLVGSPSDSAETYVSFAYTAGLTHSPYVDVPRPTANGTNYAIWTGWECPE